MTAPNTQRPAPRKAPAVKLRSVPCPAPEPIYNAETRWETDPEELGREVLALVRHVQAGSKGTFLLDETRRWAAQYPDKAAQYLLVLCTWFNSNDTTVALGDRAARILGETETLS